jgi:hypothetical protein
MAVRSHEHVSDLFLDIVHLNRKVLQPALMKMRLVFGSSDPALARDARQIRAFRLIRVFRRLRALREIVSALSVAVLSYPDKWRRPPVVHPSYCNICRAFATSARLE